ncbi:MAG: protein kinase [Kiritimatiellae bacterium]|nr:protein kinase [Kiritimatiellia bacterium]
MTHRVHTILAVDDEEQVLQLLTRQLRDLPYSIIPTSSAAEALHILKTREIAVLLCDLNMPHIDGNVVLSAAREHNPNIVSIVITGGADANATIRAINEGGIWKYLTKPWSREELAALVKDGVARYAMLCLQQSQLTRLAKVITKELPPLKAGAPRTPPPAPASRKYPPPKAPEPVPGEERLTDRYRLCEVIGEGGMGTVYRADDLLLGMPVAIKLLNTEFTRNPAAVATLKEEARIAMQLSHRHIVRLHNLQQAGDRYFLVMEHVDGRNFHEILARHGTLPLTTVRQVVQVCSEALSYAHRHHVLHRDLKPANLLLSRDGVLKVIDFGVACLVNAQEEADNVLGTPAYMSPERICGRTLDHRTDIYSLGIIVYELLTGHTPFPPEATDLHVFVEGPAGLPDLPPEVEPVVRRAVAARRSERWESVEAFARALMDTAQPAAGSRGA